MKFCRFSVSLFDTKVETQHQETCFLRSFFDSLINQFGRAELLQERLGGLLQHVEILFRQDVRQLVDVFYAPCFPERE